MSKSTPDAAPAIEAGGTAGFWSDVRGAIAGRRRDYTSIPIGRAILLLAVPMVLEMSMQSLFGVVDVFFVGKLGSAAVGVVGITDQLLTLVFAVAIGLSMGTTAMVARRVGEGDDEGASQATGQSILLGVALSLPVAVAGIWMASDLLVWMGVQGPAADAGAAYTAIILGGNVTVMLLFLINAAFRGAGDPALAMRALWIANLLNIALDPILIFGWGPIPALGLAGAAVATTLGRGVGVVYQLWKLTHPASHLQLDWRRLRLVPQVMLRLTRVSGIGVLQYLVSTASFLALVRILAVFGEAALAGYTIAVRIIIFVLLPAWGMGNAAATLVGQNLGAGDPDRAERSVWLTALCNAVFLAVLAVILIVWGEPIVLLFSRDAEAVRLAADCLRIVGYSYVFWGYGMIAVVAFNGAGDTTTPTWLHFIAYWVVQIPLAWLLAMPLGWGANGIFWSIAIGQLTIAVIGVWAFRRGTWKTRQI